MKRVAIGILMALAVIGQMQSVQAQTLHFGRLGNVTVFRQAPHPAHVVLVLSDRQGWTAQDNALGQALAAPDTLVLGIDIKGYLKYLAGTKCGYPAGDLEALSQYSQKKLGLAHYIRPVIAGRGVGATIAYGALAQAPIGTFQGALGLDFCPDTLLSRPLCPGDGLRSQADPTGPGYRVLAGSLTAPWRVLDSLNGSRCDTASAAVFVSQVPGARFSVAHSDNLTSSDATLALVRQAFLDAAQPAPSATATAKPVSDLPLVEVPATVPSNDTLVVMVSGDGGWAGLDRELAKALAARGYSIVGLNSLQYFWNRRTPDGAGADLARILNHYLQAWNKHQVLLIGYSRGADVLPFMANRLPTELRQQVQLIALLGLGRTVDFEFHLTDWLPDTSGHHNDLPIYPQVQKLRGLHVLCIYGDNELHSLCRQLNPKTFQVLGLKGGHHFDGDYAGLATTILGVLPSAPDSAGKSVAPAPAATQE